VASSPRGLAGDELMRIDLITGSMAEQCMKKKTPEHSEAPPLKL